MSPHYALKLNRQQQQQKSTLHFEAASFKNSWCLLVIVISFKGLLQPSSVYNNILHMITISEYYNNYNQYHSPSHHSLYLSHYILLQFITSSAPFWLETRIITGLLDLFDAELSPERSWRGLEFQEVREKGTIPSAALSPPEWFCIKMGSNERRINVSSIVEKQSRYQTASMRSWTLLLLKRKDTKSTGRVESNPHLFTSQNFNTRPNKPTSG